MGCKVGEKSIIHVNRGSGPNDLNSIASHPFIVAGLTEDKKCPVGKGKTSSAGLK